MNAFAHPSSRSSALRVALAFACAASLLPPVASGQKKVPGELYRQTMSMETQGLSMPGMTSEVCLPKGREQEAAAQPPDSSNCRIYDQRQSGNRFSARIECTGEDAMRGSFETVSEGDRIRGTMNVERGGRTMTMRFDTTRLGKACEALDYSDYRPAAAPAIAPQDVCGEVGPELAKRPARQLASNSFYYLGTGAVCTTRAQRKPWCDAVQTPAGFLALKEAERSVDTLDADDRAGLPMPLRDSMPACGLGSGAGAVEALRVRLLAVARDRSSWDFLILEGDAEVFASLQETAKEQCSGRAFTSAKQLRFRDLCQRYGAALVRGDRAAAREIAASTSRTAGALADAGGGDAPGASGIVDAGREDAARPAEEKPSATQELLKKGRGVLRGIFGGN